MAKNKRPAAFGDIQVEIGQRIMWARELVEPNRAEFARTLGIDRSSLCKIEDGKRAPSVFVILDLAHKLRMTTDYFLSGSIIGCDGEMAARLVKEHPALVAGRRRIGTADGTVPGTSPLPRRQGDDGHRR